jgi:predicted dehydrogenase
MGAIRWGILSTGNIADKFAEAVTTLPQARLAAVGSRTQEAADAFGKRWNVPHRHASYESLLRDSDVDVIYIATPHPMHFENAMACLRAGKAVLCEKPFAMRAFEAEKMVALAREKRLFLMEAMWTRYHPAIKKVRAMLAEGALGDVRLMQSDFCFRATFDPNGRLFNRALGGGGLLDLGIYPVSLASMVFGGPPRNIVSNAHIGSTGVDDQASVILEYSEGRQAVMTFGLLLDSPQETRIAGTAGHLRIHQPWWHPQELTWHKADGSDESIHLAFPGNGYEQEATEVMECMQSGRLESPAMPLEETISLMRTLDAIRAQWGLRYPGDPG